MIENWHPIQIYFHDNIETSGEILQEIKSVEDQIEKFYKPNVWCDNVHSTFKTIHSTIFELNLIKLNAFLYSHVFNYISELNIKPDRVYLQESWFNKMEKYGYQDKHVHGYNTISGCYYFENSMYEEEGITFYSFNKFGIEANIHYPFRTNRLILFPGLLEHSVKFKKSAGVRKSLSFNFKIE